MRIAVVGAGISGLTCAHRLAARGHEVVVYEAGAAVGGRMRTVVKEGLAVDVGANLLLANYDRLHALAAELGIADTLFAFEAGSGGILRDDELTSFTPKSAFDVLRYRGVSFASRMQLLRYFLRATAWTASLDFFDLSVGDDADEGRDAHAVVTERLGGEVADYLVDPFVRTFHFHGSHEISMKAFDALAALFVGRDGFVPTGFRGFMSALPQALAAGLDVRLGKVIRSVRPAAVAAPASGGVRVDGEAYDRVVLAVPAPIALGMLEGGAAPMRTLLAATRYAATLDVAFRVPLSVAEDFEGIWVPFRESVVISECANDACKGCHDGTDCVFTMGLHAETGSHWLDRSDEAIFHDVALEWARLFPRYAGHLRGLHVERWPHAIPIYSPDHVAGVRAFLARTDGAGQGAGGVYLCGDFLNHPWVEGSIRSGEKVASWIEQSSA
ncbi:MAG: FAD-dependent oxidoreductase [Deltaproteobacteria bacterium]|nr:FAD-dependent oxidoreductase [Deltaproteobacteria bacterium]